MNWAKSKTILIIALLITNIFLLINYTSANYKKPETTQLERSVVEFLRENNVFIYAAIPSDTYNLPVLEVEVEKFDKEVVDRIIAEYDQAFPQEVSREALLLYAETFMIENDLIEKSAVLDKLTSLNNNYVLEYRNKDISSDIYIEESYLVCTISKNRITNIEKRWIKAKEYGQTKKNTISATKALLKFMSEDETNRAISVTNIEMVYWVDSSFVNTENTTLDTAFPAWKITYNNEKEKYILAYEE